VKHVEVKPPKRHDERKMPIRRDSEQFIPSPAQRAAGAGAAATAARGSGRGGLVALKRSEPTATDDSAGEEPAQKRSKTAKGKVGASVKERLQVEKGKVRAASTPAANIQDRLSSKGVGAAASAGLQSKSGKAKVNDSVTSASTVAKGNNAKAVAAQVDMEAQRTALLARMKEAKARKTGKAAVPAKVTVQKKVNSGGVVWCVWWGCLAVCCPVLLCVGWAMREKRGWWCARGTCACERERSARCEKMYTCEKVEQSVRQAFAKRDAAHGPKTTQPPLSYTLRASSMQNPNIDQHIWLAGFAVHCSFKQPSCFGKLAVAKKTLEPDHDCE
jgi:hypothetical protein